jgi:hypothetical protein
MSSDFVLPVTDRQVIHRFHRYPQWDLLRLGYATGCSKTPIFRAW